MLQKAYWDLYRTITIATEYIGSRDKFGQMFTDGFTHFLVMTQPVPRTSGKKVIPLAAVLFVGVGFGHIIHHY